MLDFDAVILIRIIRGRRPANPEPYFAYAAEG